MATALAIANGPFNNAVAQDVTGPRITRLQIASAPQRGDTYALGNEIRAAIWYDEELLMVGKPRLRLQVGAETRIMSLDLCTGCGVGTGAVFVYTVRESDHDADGIGIAPDALILDDEASITDLAGNDAEVDLSGHVFDSHPDHKVDGSVNHRPIARRLQIHSKPNAEDTYRVGEIILLNIEFDEHVIVSGFPKLELQIGDHARLAELDESWSREGPLAFLTMRCKPRITTQTVSV